MLGKKINQISGLDPAGLCFFVQSPEKRLADTDADFIDVIHTDTDTLEINNLYVVYNII